MENIACKNKSNLELDLNELNYFQNKLAKFEGVHRKLCVIKQVHYDMTPLTPFPNTVKAGNFKEYHQNVNKLPTSKDTQPLVEVEKFSLNSNYILRSRTLKTSTQEKKPNYKELYILEHLKLIPFESDHINLFSMLPTIFYRANSILKAQKFQLLIENYIKENLKIEQVFYEQAGWESSIKFHRIKQDENSISNASSYLNLNENYPSSMDEDESDEENVMVIYKKEENSLNQDLTEFNLVPPLFIKEENNFSFPNVYNILQCLTLKTASDNFDLERYEIIGDCFLKLTVVLKIYIEFFTTNEGKMATLKSQRVSNKYLYKLAVKKKLNEFVVSQNFNYKENWIAPFFDTDKLKQDARGKVKLADKSLADCVEALIGVYLICLGTNAAKAFIQWLDFAVSDQLGNVKFSDKVQLPDPIIGKYDDELTNQLKIRYANFEEEIGYEFKNIYYLLQAFTHPSDITNRSTSSYQKY